MSTESETPASKIAGISVRHSPQSPDGTAIKDSWLRRLRDWLWGYDYFISYHWDSSGAYAVALAQRLRNRGFQCFLDRAEYAMGDDWKKEGRRALRNTQRLVVIATPEAVTKSKAVEREVEIFVARSSHVIPVVFGNDLAHLEIERFPVLRTIAGALHIRERSARLATRPSIYVVKQLVQTHRVLRRRTLRACITASVTAILALAAVAVGALALLENRARREAEHQTTVAHESEIVAKIQLFDSLLSEALAVRSTTISDRRTKAENLVSRASKLIRVLPARVDALSRCRNELSNDLTLPDLSPTLTRLLPAPQEMAEYIPVPAPSDDVQVAPKQVGYGVPYADWYRHQAWIRAWVAFRPGGDILMVPAPGYPVSVQPDGRTKDHKTAGEPLNLVGLSSEGRWACDVSSSGTISLVDLARKKQPRPLVDGSGRLLTGSCLAAFTGDAQRLGILLIGNQVGSLPYHRQTRFLLYSTDDAKCLSEWTQTLAVPDSIALAPQADIVALCIGVPSVSPESVHVFDATNGAYRYAMTIENQASPPGLVRRQGIDISNDGSLVAATGHGGTVKAWRFSTLPGGAGHGAYLNHGMPPSEVLSIRGHVGGIGGGAGAVGCKFSPDGRWLLTVGGDAELKLWNMEDGKLSGAVRLAQNSISFDAAGIAWSANADRVMCIGTPGLSVWRLTKPWPSTYPVGDHPTTVRSLSFSADDRWLAVGSWVIDLRGDFYFAPEGFQLSAKAVFGPRNALFMISGHNGVSEYHLPSPVESRRQRLPLNEISAAACDEHDRVVVVGNEHGIALALFEPAARRRLWRTIDYSRLTTSGRLAFSQDGQQIAQVFGLGNPEDPRAARRRFVVRATGDGHILHAKTLPEGGYEQSDVFFRGNVPIAMLRTSDLLQVQLADQEVVGATVSAGKRQGMEIVSLPGGIAAVSADGRHAAGFGTDGSVTVHDLVTGDPVVAAKAVTRELSETNVVRDVRLSADGRLLGVLTSRTLTVWQVGQDCSRRTLSCSAVCFRFLGDDGVILLQRDGRLVKWILDQDETTDVFRIPLDAGLESSTPQCRISPTGRFVAIARPLPGPEWLPPAVQPTFRIQLWDLSSPASGPWSLDDFTGSLLEWRFDDATERLAVLTQHGVMTTYDATVGREIMRLPDQVGTWFHSRLSPRAGYLIQPKNSEDAGVTTVYPLGVGTRERTIISDCNVSGVDAAERPRRILLNERKQLRLLGAEDEVAVLSAPLGVEFRHCAISEDGSVIAGALDSGVVQLWDGASRAYLVAIETGFGAVEQVGLSHTGRLLAACDGQGRTRVWDLSVLRKRLLDLGLDWGGRLAADEAVATRATDGGRVIEGSCSTTNAAQSLATLNLAIECSPSNPILYRDRALLFENLNYVDQAIDDLWMVRGLDKTVLVGQRLAGLLQKRGEGLLAAGDWQRAARCFADATAAWDLGPEGLEERELVDYILQRGVQASLAVGDVRTAIRACQIGMQRLERSTQAGGILSLCLLFPDGLIDWKSIRQEAVFQAYFGARHLLGATLIRAGFVQRGVRELEFWNGAQRDALDEVFLALGYALLDNVEEASEHLEAADSKSQQEISQLGEVERRLRASELAFVRKEVERLLPGRN